MESNRAGLAAILKHAAPNAILSGHFRSLLAQFGLTPKSKRGVAASEVVEIASYVLHYGISARPSLRASVADFARFTGSASGDFT